jgi:hypothetical protein
MDETPTSDAPLPLDRRIGRRIPLPSDATLSFPERRPFRRVRRVSTDVDVVDVSITGVAVRVLGHVRIPTGTTVRLWYRGSAGAAVVRHVTEPSSTGSRVYGLEVVEASQGLTRAIRGAVGEQRDDVSWRWEEDG